MGVGEESGDGGGEESMKFCWRARRECGHEIVGFFCLVLLPKVGEHSAVSLRALDGSLEKVTSLLFLLHRGVGHLSVPTMLSIHNVRSLRLDHL